MSRKFIPVEFLGSDFEISKIANATIDTLERDFNIRINQEVIVPAIVDCFIDSAFCESVAFAKDDVKKELNLFNLLRIINQIDPDTKEVIPVMSLGRMGMRLLNIEFDEEEHEKLATTIADIDIKLLEKISMRASDYLEDRHNLPIRDYQIIFKVAEVFFRELISFLKISEIPEDTLTVFDQFTIILNDDGLFESIELTESAEQFIKIMFDENMMALAKLELEDEAGVSNAK